MSEFTLISPLLDGFAMGSPITEHDGVFCCPAIRESDAEKYIVKIISVPQSQVQLDALLLTGACSTPADASDYFRDVAESIVKEAEYLNSMARLEGFAAFDGCQIVPMGEDQVGFRVYLLSKYKRSLQRYTSRNPVTHLQAVNLGLDLCTALSICRRSGYLYVNLKPSNVFLTNGREFRIGDLGFMKLESLDYQSLPGKYRSPYSPPEAMDDMKTLNTTIDTYAVGMILYQIYNEGTLPAPPLEPKDPFPCPSNADYEISAIIMKAVDPDPAKRWESPMQMGQALVGYMQRNSINNVPITPPTGVVQTDAPLLSETGKIPKPVPEQAPSQPEPPAAPEPEVPASPAPEKEETAPVEKAEEEVTPVILPETEPAPEEPAIPEAEAPEMVFEEELDLSLDFQEFLEEPQPPVTVAKPWKPEPKPVQAPARKPRKSGWQRAASALVVLLILAGLACGGFWFYQTQYIQQIDGLTVDGNQSQLTVTVDTKMDTALLQVSCTDTYGNTTTQPFRNGQAVFTDLLPDSLYRIELSVSGFHSLTGKTAEIFTTDALTEIISISAIAGPEDGSVILNFTVGGPEPEEWTITCTADGETPVTQSFTGHNVTVRGLTVGKTYQLTLGAGEGNELLGQASLEYAATKLILAENLTIVSCVDGLMTVRWDAPEGVTVEKWNVRCYNDDGHEEVLEIGGTEIALSGIDSNKAYTVEVTAAGMTEPNRVSITANPLTITDFTVDDSAVGKLSVNWSFTGNAPEGGWLLLYSLDDQYDQQGVVKCADASAVIENTIPGATYNFTVQAADSTSLFNSQHSFKAPDAGLFTNEGLSADYISAHLLVTPDDPEWTCESVGTDVYTDSFLTGEDISIVLKARDSFYLPEMDIHILYVIRNGNGSVLSQYTARETVDWKALWYDDDYHNCELALPNVPAEAGSYTLNIYFDNLYVASTNFTVSE